MSSGDGETTLLIYAGAKGKQLLKEMLPDRGDFGATGAAQMMIPVDWEKAPEGAYVLFGDTTPEGVYVDVYGTREFADHVKRVLQDLVDKREKESEVARDAAS
ncbi:MAG: hypothetical protein QMD46_07025 [Methanomicrobiales archaeon]|nr:hypothetical protein [Methanomicrobiales archaeon]